jgi:hypothetical protein
MNINEIEDTHEDEVRGLNVSLGMLRLNPMGTKKEE